jgi:hypothetical protein
MSHKPPLPEAAISSYPVHPTPFSPAPPEETVSPNAEPTGDKTMSGRTIGIAAGAAAIGSAAIAAALIFYNRSSAAPGSAREKSVPPKKPATANNAASGKAGLAKSV